MNKSDLIDVMAEKAGISKKAAGDALDAALESIAKSLAKGDAVTLVGFGTFAVKKRKARTGINPKTKEKIKIAAKKVPVFKPGSSLKDKVK